MEVIPESTGVSNKASKIEGIYAEGWASGIGMICLANTFFVSIHSRIQYKLMTLKDSMFHCQKIMAS